MKAKITLLLLIIAIGLNMSYGQFTADKPDLRLCGTAPNYYTDYFNCTSNNYTLDDVFLSLTDINGVPLDDTTCTPGSSHTMYIMLNYTSNSNSDIYHARIFADLIIDGVTTSINVNFGTVSPGTGQRLLYGPFTWICGQEIILNRILIVWKTSGNNTELTPYDCHSYNRSQCELPGGVVVTAPLAVQFTYSGCTNGNQSTINFDSTTNGGTPPYSYAWDFDSNGTIDSTVENPTFTYNNSNSYNATLTVTDANGLSNFYTVPILYPTEITIVANVQPLNCTPNSTAAIDITVTGGTPPYSYLWNTGQTTEDLSNLDVGTYSLTVTDALGCTKNYSTTISPVVCCQFEVSCPTFSPIAIQCYDLLPIEGILTEADFEALGNGDGIIGNNPCGVIVITAQNSAYAGCNSNITRTYTITEYQDDNNNGIHESNETTILNTITCNQTILINDITPPSIATQASNSTVECSSTNGTEFNTWLNNNGGAVASDSCGNVTWTRVGDSISDECGTTGSATVTFRATDDCGNFSETTATFTIQDTTAPTIDILASDVTVECDGNGNAADLQNWLASNGGASSTDACSTVTWTNDYSALSDDCGATGSVLVTFTATDDCGNATMTSATFTIQDTTAPTIDILASDVTVECDGNGNTADLQNWLASNGGASSTDACSSVTWSNDYSALSDDCGASGSVLVTFTATDDCGNTTMTSATFTIQDTTAPTINVLASDVTVECDGNGNIADLQAWLSSNGGASSTDACSSVTWSNDYSALSDDCGANGSVLVTFTATDDCGNATMTSATFSIQDTTAPTINVLASDVTVECDGNGNTADLQNWLASNGGASSTDACSTVTWTNDYSSLSDDCGASGSVLVTFTATDDCGNSSTSSATFTIQDTTAPTIDILASDVTVECDGNGNASDLQSWLASNGGASSTDACSTVTWINDYNTISDDCGASGSVLVTFTATDDCGNTTMTSATFTIQDTTAPTINVLASDVTVECDGNGNIADLQAWLSSNGGASSTDACSSVTWSNDYSALSDDCGANGSVLVTFTATDDCGNATMTSATFSIQDTTAPTINVLASDVTVECDGNGNTADLQNWLASNGGASSTDACSTVTWTNDYSSLSDDCGASGSVLVTFTATDDCGNSSTSSATFTIQDTTAPTIDILASDVTVECDGNGNASDLQSWLASNGGASSTDACSTVTWINDYNTISDDCGASGSVLVTFTATDDCGNSSTSSATFTIQDTTAPTIDTLASDVTVECDGNGNIADLQAWLSSNGGASSTDACSSVTWTNDYSSLSDDCGASGSVLVTFTATDDCGNSSTSSATFTIQDTTAPTINVLASDVTVECDGNGNTADLQSWLASNGGASSTDACSTVTWSNDYSSLSDDCGASGSVLVTFTATDDCGNATMTSATFTIQDTTAPTINVLASDVTVECDGNGNTADLQSWLASNGGASATDACSSVTWTNDYSALSDDCGASGSVLVTFTATDDCGNSLTSSATFTIQDTTAPTIDILASDVTVECDGNGNTSDLQAWLASNGGAASTDACSTVTWSNDYSALSDDCGASGSVLVTFTATDYCGNATMTSATFTIQDTTAPTIDILASDVTVECDGNGNTSDLQAWLASNGGAASTDACSTVTWSNDYSALSDDCGASGSVLVTFTATDDCGNATMTSATFTIQDTTAPTIDTLASDVTVECDGNGNIADLQSWLASNGGASSTDACSSVTWTNDYNTISDDCGASGSVLVTFTATDDCGNSSTSSATFTIQDTTAPTIDTLASDVTVECDGNGNIADLQSWLASNGGASSTDACSTVTWTNDYSSLSDDCGASGSVLVTFTATDDCGNATMTSATFTIQDTTAPTFSSSLPADMSVECDEIPIAATVLATDTCSSSTTVTLNEEIISEGESGAGEYTLIRTWTATDSCGNETSYSQTISIYDITPPVLVTPIDTELTVACSEIPEIPQLELSDNCSNVADIVYNETTTTISIYEYIIIREWTFYDDCGNNDTITQTINVTVSQPFDAIPYNICTEEKSIDLFSILGESIPTNGEWIEVTNSGGLSGSYFDPTNVTVGYYTLQYIVDLEDNDCPIVYEIYMHVHDDCVILPACSVKVYNAVSPNNDGYNDVFFIDGLTCYPDNSVQIYNRWGILVYDASGYDNQMIAFKGYSEGRGTFNKNELLPDGTYFYIIKYRDEQNQTIDLSGYLYLTR